SPVNLLLKERLVPELLQDELTAEALVQAAIPLLEDPAQRNEMLEGYLRLRQTLGVPGVTDRAAKEILDLTKT
ncbi:MAG TPA: lipid-A-disaccharide synthase, partial [Prochlorococcus sp.]|nr:lipid-A-disaccharide synthase [Prochlorococcus sp.]